ncbi:MAG: helix-turn-helix domain-containing protein [Myxococcota bacterium]
MGDWWNPLIIRECLIGPKRFDELHGFLEVGRNILSGRLVQLVEQGVLEKQLYQQKPPRYRYRLTDKGYDAALILFAMMPFGERWFFDGETPIQLYSRSTGKKVRPILVDADTGQPIDPRDVYSGPGPAFPMNESTSRARFIEYYERLNREALKP